jgi:hypothetical protein
VNRATPLALLLLAAGMLGAGCVSTRVGSAEPAMAPPAPTPSATLAPRVPKQLDAGHLVNSPCDALTAGQLNGLDPALGSVVGTNASDPLGAACGWSSPDLSQAVNISFATAAPDGLDQIYSEHPYMAYWQPMVIDGYPAVAASQYDARPDGSCVVNAGLNDHLYFFAEFMTFNPAQQSRSCALAAQAAGDVITNLRGGN